MPGLADMPSLLDLGSTCEDPLWRLGQLHKTIPRVPPLDVFAQNVSRARKRRRLTQEEVSNRSGIHVTEVSRIERGLRDPRVTTLVRLADALEVSPAVLLRGVAPILPG